MNNMSHRTKVCSLALVFGLLQLVIAHAAYAQTKNPYPNQPPGFVALTNWSFASPTGAGGGWTTPRGANGTVVNDPTAPISPPSVARNYRDATSNHESEFWYALPNGTDEFYLAFSVKLSLPAYGWFNGQYQKILLIGDTTPHAYFYVYGLDNSSGTASFQQADEAYEAPTPNGQATGCSSDDCRFPCNISSCTRSLGQWHIVEIYYKAGNGNGILRQYLDGQLTTSYSNLYLPAVEDGICLCNIWDSIDSSLPQMEYVEYDNAYISVPGSGSHGTLAAPTNLKVN